MIDGRTQSGSAHAFAAAIVLLLLAAPLAAQHATGQSGSGDLGEILWPSEGNRQFSALTDGGASLFDQEADPIRLGLGPLETVTLERESNSSTRLVVDERGRSAVSLVQPHAPTNVDGHTTLRVGPSDLQPTVEGQLDPGRTSAYVLTLTGPPASFDLEGATAEEKVNALAEDIDFPLEETDNGTPPAAFPRLFGGQQGCFDSTEGECNTSAAFALRCSSCSLVTFHGPSGDSSLDRDGFGMALFDDEDRLLAATFTFAFDVDESAVQEPSSAREQAADQLQDRGYEVDSMPDAEEVHVSTVLADHRVAVEEIRYGWHFAVSDGGSEVDGEPVPPGGGVAEVEQNAETGDIISLKIDAADIAEEPAEKSAQEPSNENVTLVPSIAIMALLAATFIARTR